MPRRSKVDRAPIIASLERTGDRDATAIELGLHYNTVAAIDRLRLGMCMSCGRQPPRTGFTKCSGCATRERERTARKRKDARKIGKCSMCPSPLMKGSILYCSEHYQSTLARQRVHRMTDKYGPEAIKVWNEAGERCQVCGEAHAESRNHLHHIDGDHANAARENFIILCHGCHRAVHLLLASKDRVALISWFAATYPDRPLS